mgnify:CR=1 FL=1
MKRKFYALGLVVSLALSAVTPAWAAQQVQVYVDGEKVSFDQAPVIESGRTLVPMNAIFTAMGSEVVWDEANRTVIANHGSDTFTLQIGQNEIYKNGALLYTMDVPAKIIGSRTMVPVRVVSESLGAAVLWDEDNYIITITSPMEGTSASYFNTTLTASDGTPILKTSVAYPVIDGSSDAIHRINQALYQQALAVEQNFLTQYLSSAQNAYQANGSAFQPYYMTGTAASTYLDHGILSAVSNTSSYTGGAITYSRTSATFDLATGQSLELTDLVSDGRNALVDLMTAGFSAIIDAAPSAFYSDAKSRLANALDQAAFYVSEDGITFFLNPGIIAPAEAGIISFSVPYTL